MYVYPDITGLGAGTYTGTITVNSNAGSQNVTVTLQLTAEPLLTMLSTSESFTAVWGGSNPDDEAFGIANSGTADLTWTASDNRSWMWLDRTSGTLEPGGIKVISINVDITGMSAGTYTGTITVNSNGGSGTVNVSLAIQTPELYTSPSSFTFECEYGPLKPNPGSQTLYIRNASGDGTLNWNLSDNATWLTLSPTSGTNHEDVTVTCKKGLLTRGTYTGTITVNSNAGSRSIPVSFTIN